MSSQFDMMSSLLCCVTVLIGAACGFNQTFPTNFMIGAASSAYQIEGAWNESGKGVSIWDTYVRETHCTANGSTADVSADSYHQYEQDVSALKEMAVDFYRFSVSWPRILPNGHANVINWAGVDYYNKLINELKANGIEPMMTMYHWDLPQPLQDLGGWTNPVMADYFEEYAYVLFSNFGDRVKWWITINEMCYVTLGYKDAHPYAPGVEAKGIGQYLAAHTLIQAHAKVYRLYEKKFKAEQKGKLSLSLNTYWFEPMTNSSADIEAAEMMMQLELGLFAHPIYSSEGDYPQTVRKLLDKVSVAQGYNRSQLRHFSPEEVSNIRGTYDFFGLNYYTARSVKSLLSLNDVAKSEYSYVNVTVSTKSSTVAPLFEVTVPWGLRKLLIWIKEKYQNVPVFITENGFADNGEINDIGRSKCIVSHMSEMLKAIHEDGCNVIGYTVWSLIDNMEWCDGYTFKLGLYNVNFSDPNRQRTPKTSAHIFSEINKRRQLPRYLLEITGELSSEITTEHPLNNSCSVKQNNTAASCGRNLFTYSKTFVFLWLATVTWSNNIFRS